MKNQVKSYRATDKIAGTFRFDIIDTLENAIEEAKRDCGPADWPENVIWDCAVYADEKDIRVAEVNRDHVLWIRPDYVPMLAF